MNSYIMSHMDLHGRSSHRQIKPESLTFHNEIKINRTKANLTLNTSKIVGTNLGNFIKRSNEFDTNQGNVRGTDIKSLP